MNGTAIVVDAENKKKTTTVEDDAKDIDFYLDVMCCDPNDTDCKACESTELDAFPIMKIGPKSNAESRFYIKTGMDTHNRNLGYFHVEKLHYKGFDHNASMINNFDMIEEGCNLVGGLIEFKSEFSFAE